MASTALLAGYVGSGLVAFVFVVVIARTLGPESRGVVAFVTTVPVVTSLASMVGLDISYLYHSGARPQLQPAIVSSSILSGLVTGTVGAVVVLVVFLISPSLAPSELGIGLVVVSVAMTPLLSIERLLNLTMIGSQRVGLANAVLVATPSVSLAAFVVLGLASSFSSTTAIVGWCVGRVAGAVLSSVLAARSIGFGKGEEVREATNLALRYGLRAYPSSLATLPLRRFDTLLLGATGRTDELGLYTAGVNVAETMMYLPHSVANVLLPGAAAQADLAAAVSVRRAGAVVLTLVSAASCIGIVLAPQLIHVLFGTAYRGSVLPLQLLLVAMIGWSAKSVYEAGLMARDKVGLASIITVVTMVVIVGLDLALIPPMGAVGAALAAAIAYCVGGLATFVLYRGSIPPATRGALPGYRATLTAGIRLLRHRRGRSASYRER